MDRSLSAKDQFIVLAEYAQSILQGEQRKVFLSLLAEDYRAAGIKDRLPKFMENSIFLQQI